MKFMKILAIDTSSEICSTALLEDDKKIDERNLDNGMTHSENLMPLLDELLKSNNIDIKDIDLFACSVGPGSFTGIRIGISTIKPFAEVLDKPIASVTSLETLAVNDENNEGVIVSLIDARNNQVYAGVFDNNYNKLEEYIADDINKVIEIIKKYNKVVFVGNASVIHKELLQKNIDDAIFISNNKQSALNVGIIAYKKYLSNDLCNADTVFPLYLRKSQAERIAEG